MSTNVPVQLPAIKTLDPKRGVAIVLAITLAALALLFFVIYGHGHAAAPPAWIGWLPALNATLNGTSAISLVLAGLAIRRRAVAAHTRRMLGALASSALFVVSYILYHSIHGDSHFGGQGIVRPMYFVILISHVVLSAVVSRETRVRPRHDRRAHRLPTSVRRTGVGEPVVWEQPSEHGVGRHLPGRRGSSRRGDRQCFRADVISSRASRSPTSCFSVRPSSSPGGS